MQYILIVLAFLFITYTSMDLMKESSELRERVARVEERLEINKEKKIK